MKLKLLCITCTLLLLLTGTVFSAVVGKITGVVTDAETQQPLVGVTVSVQGTTWGAITDPDGRYSILNVPVGDYTVVMTAVGYATVEISNVIVHADLAAYVNQAMTPQAAELGTVIEVRAEQQLVTRDKTTSVNIVRSEEIQAMPTRGFEQVVGIQNSVVRMNSNVDTRQRGGRESRAASPELNLRGGRPSEVAYYVDGFSQQDPLSGISTANVSNNAIKEVSVTSGAFSAEYGHVASGIVNVVTNSGSDEYHVAIEGVTDNFLDSDNKPVFDHNFYTGDVSGPIPGLKNGYFYLSGERRYQEDRTPSIKTKEIYEQFGWESRNTMPNNWLEGWSYQGKLDYNFSPTVKLTLNGNGSIDRWSEYSHFYNHPRFPDQVKHSPRYEDTNMGLNAKITHTLNANTFYNLSGSYFMTQRVRGDGVLFDNVEAYQRDYPNPEWDDFNLFAEGDSIFADDEFVTFLEHYVSGSILKRKSSYIGFKGDITSQISASQTLKFGFDFQRHTTRFYQNFDASVDYSTENVNRYGYDIFGNESDLEDWEIERILLNADGTTDTVYAFGAKHPINLGIYLTDRLDWRGLIVNAGLRFDYFDYKAKQTKNVTYPLDPTNAGDLLGSVIDPTDLKDSEKFTRVSPRLGVSFPVSDITQLHVNYGQFYQRPDLVRLFVGYDFFGARIGAGSYYAQPNPNLKPEKIIQYEVGITHQLGEFTAFDLTAYYKDVQDLVQIFHQAPAFPFAYDYYGNTDYGTIKGVDFSVNMRRTRNIAMQLKYSLSYASGTGSYANSTFNIAWKNPGGTPKSTNPLDYDQRHSIIAMFDLRSMKGEGPLVGNIRPLENFGLNIVAQLASGLPYTPMEVYDAVSPNASVQQTPTGGINSARMPWTFVIDLKLERTFQVGNYQIRPYIWVKNLLDRENIVAVYEGTGEPNTSGYLESPEGVVRASDPEDGAEFAYRYDALQNNPKNWSNPRMVFAGLRLSF
ncbi:MAG: TonB-dependent receptor [Candidatus Zixiibacteriota bacterium]